MPPWLQEQLMKMQQSQQNLQSIMTQKQHLEMENIEIDKALDELKKADLFKESQDGRLRIKAKLATYKLIAKYGVYVDTVALY